MNSEPLSLRMCSEAPRTTHREQILQRQDHFLRVKRSARFDGQALPRELIDHHQQLQLPAVFRPLRHKVIRPHVIAMRRSMTHAAVVAASEARQSPAFMLPVRHLHVFLFPYPMDTIKSRPTSPTDSTTGAHVRIRTAAGHRRSCASLSAGGGPSPVACVGTAGCCGAG